MPFRWNYREHLTLARYALKWLVIGVPVGAVIGSAVAAFLWLLERATQLRFQSDLPSGMPWLLFLLPVGGVGIGLLYHRFGRSVEGGNNLVMEQIHAPAGGVPARMTPLVLVGTVLTHLFGGSAGREGTAVQMGGSIASTLGRWMRLNPADTSTLLQAGIAAGFGAVFGTPLTGALFALEVLAIGVVRYGALLPCLIASVAGDYFTRVWGIQHTAYHIGALVQTQLVSRVPELNWLMLAKVALASLTFGLASVLFAELTHGLHRVFKWMMPVPYLRPAIGAVLVIALAYAVGPDYLGLGVTADPHHPRQICIVSCFHAGGAGALSWWWKILFTAVTLGSGFKGGEVTPLFFVGAALGNAMARLLHAPVDLFAGLGFVGVFAGATNTPMACTVMGIELFAASAGPNWLNSGFVVYLATACFVAYLMSGHTGIYLSQRVAHPKLASLQLPPDADLRQAREMSPRLGGSGFLRGRSEADRAEETPDDPARLE
jgi:H+/Cl- antiporter ClcA